MHPAKLFSIIPGKSESISENVGIEVDFTMPCMGSEWEQRPSIDISDLVVVAVGNLVDE